MRTLTGPGATRDGHAVPLLANVGGPRDVAAALEHGAEGVGLFRTEFLFLDRTTPPGEDEQEAAYRTVLEAFTYVVVRTLDAGADKPLAFLPARARGAQPGPGRTRPAHVAPPPRGARRPSCAPSPARPARLPVELRVMAPMVADAEEAAAFAEACRAAGIAHAGVMIEIPAAALRARDLAAEADFFSIGTNDLAQYAFAADRQVGALSGLQDPWQPALLDLVALAAEGAGGKPCGVCGEAAADPVLACVLTGLGVTSLSMSAPALPAVRAALRRLHAGGVPPPPGPPHVRHATPPVRGGVHVPNCPACPTWDSDPACARGLLLACGVISVVRVRRTTGWKIRVRSRGRCDGRVRMPSVRCRPPRHPSPQRGGVHAAVDPVAAASAARGRPRPAR